MTQQVTPFFRLSYELCHIQSPQQVLNFLPTTRELLDQALIDTGNPLVLTATFHLYLNEREEGEQVVAVRCYFPNVRKCSHPTDYEFAINDFLYRVTGTLNPLLPTESFNWCCYKITLVNTRQGTTLKTWDNHNRLR